MTNKYECAKCGTIFNSNNRETCPSCKTKAVEEVATPFSAGSVGHIGTGGSTAISKPSRSTANYKEIDYLQEISNELKEANRHLSFLHNLGMLHLMLFLLGLIAICFGLYGN